MQPAPLSKLKTLMNNFYSTEAITVGTVNVQAKNETTKESMSRELTFVSQRQDELTRKDIEEAPEPSALTEELDRMRDLENARIERVTGETYADSVERLLAESFSKEDYYKLRIIQHKLLDARVALENSHNDWTGLPSKEPALVIREAVEVFSDYGYKPSRVTLLGMESFAYGTEKDAELALEGLVDWVKGKLNDWKEYRWKNLLDANKLSISLLKSNKSLEIKVKPFEPLGKYFTPLQRKEATRNFGAVITHMSLMVQATYKIAQREMDAINALARHFNYDIKGFNLNEFENAVNEQLKAQKELFSRELDMIGSGKGGQPKGIVLPYHYEQDKEKGYVIKSNVDPDKNRNFNFSSDLKYKIGDMIKPCDSILDEIKKLSKLSSVSQWYTINANQDILKKFREAKHPDVAKIERRLAVIDLGVDVLFEHLEKTISAFTKILNKTIYDTTKEKQ